MAFESLMACQIDVRKNLACYTVVGGTSKAKGFEERFLNEMRKLTPTPVRIFGHRFPEMAWVGGSILASLCVTFGSML
jgi:actin-related protein